LKTDTSISQYGAAFLCLLVIIGVLLFGLRETLDKQAQKKKLFQEKRDNPYISLTPYEKRKWPHDELVPSFKIKDFEIVKGSDITSHSMRSQALAALGEVSKSLSISSETFGVKTMMIAVHPAEHLSFQIEFRQDGRVVSQGMFVAPHPESDTQPNWLDYWMSEVIRMASEENKPLIQRDPYDEEGKGTF